MFLENDYARPLFDFEKGGKPKAFECLMCKADHANHKTNPCGRMCGKVTRTEIGMRMHLKTVHGWEEQACLYSTDKQTDQNSGSPRQLRAGPPRFPESETAVENHTEKILHNQKSAETNEGELLKLMKGGN